MLIPVLEMKGSYSGISRNVGVTSLRSAHRTYDNGDQLHSFLPLYLLPQSSDSYHTANLGQNMMHDDRRRG